MAAYVGKAEIMKLIAPSGKVYQAGTYSGNPISVATGLATLKTLRDSGEKFYAKMEEKCKLIVNPLEKIIGESDLKLQISHVASMFQLFFTENSVYDYQSVKTADNNKFMKYHTKLLKKGIFVPPSQFETCFLSTTHSKQDIDHTVEVASAILSEQT